MLVELTHPQLTKMYELGVFNSVNSVKDMCGAITRFSLTEPLIETTDPDRDPKDKQKKFRGDAFEVFGEFLCRVTENDSRLGVRNAEIVPLDEDVGVDLHGESTMGDGPVAVQFKFKADPTYTFKFRELATWLAASGHIFNASGRNLILITTGMTVNYRVLQVVPKLRVVNREKIRLMTDGNIGFWNDLRESIKQSALQPKARSKRVLYPDQEEAIGEIENWMDN